MPSSRATIAQAAADLLAAASGSDTFSGLTFTVERKALPANTIERLQTVTGGAGGASPKPLLTVCPIGPEPRSLVGRKMVQKIFSIDIGIQQRLAPDCNPGTPAANTAIDALMLFAEQVALFFQPDGVNRGVVCTSPEATWYDKDNAIDPPYDTEHLREYRVFTSRVILTVRYF